MIRPAAADRVFRIMRTVSTTTIEKPRDAGPGEGLGGAWRVIVRNDNHNTFEHVAETLARVLPGVSVEHGHRIAERIHNTGQAIVWSGPREPAEHYWEQLKVAGLTLAPLERG
jgi:ATP-dependent Clp protease adaptor protein ClpS